jgi:hypothetical protein
VLIPRPGPVTSILVNRSKKEVVKKPDVSLEVWSEAAAVLQTEEEVAPFAAKAAGHIAPETLNANIMYTPAKYIRYTSTSGDATEHLLCLGL